MQGKSHRKWNWKELLCFSLNWFTCSMILYMFTCYIVHIFMGCKGACLGVPKGGCRARAFQCWCIASAMASLKSRRKKLSGRIFNEIRVDVQNVGKMSTSLITVEFENNAEVSYTLLHWEKNGTTTAYNSVNTSVFSVACFMYLSHKPFRRGGVKHSCSASPSFIPFGLPWQLPAALVKTVSSKKKEIGRKAMMDHWLCCGTRSGSSSWMRTSSFTEFGG